MFFSLNWLFNPLSKFKAFADDKLNLAKMMIFLLDKVENTVGKGENADYQHFLSFSYSVLQSFLP